MLSSFPEDAQSVLLEELLPIEIAWRHKSGETTTADYDFRNLGNLPVSQEFPAYSICWHDAQAFCDWLSQRESETYRLPTVAEWQLANAAGNTAKWFFGDDDACLTEFAWYKDNAGLGFHNVAKKRPDSLGIFDALGNEYEWCLGSVRGPPDEGLRPQVGGGFGDTAEEISRWTRAPELVPMDRGLHGAFRVIREL